MVSRPWAIFLTEEDGRATRCPIVSFRAVPITMEVASTPHKAKERIVGLLEMYEGDRQKTAKALGVSVRTLYRYLVQLRIIT
jgi:DNA-binding NtrC family response regulator